MKATYTLLSYSVIFGTYIERGESAGVNMLTDSTCMVSLSSLTEEQQAYPQTNTDGRQEISARVQIGRESFLLLSIRPYTSHYTEACVQAELDSLDWIWSVYLQALLLRQSRLWRL